MSKLPLTVQETTARRSPHGLPEVAASSSAFVAGFALLLFLFPGLLADEPFVRGDANADGVVSISDGALIAAFRFLDDSGPGCLDSADYDDNGYVDSDDAAFILTNLAGEPVREPTAPFPEAGGDPTDDLLGCDVYQPAAPRETSELLRLGTVEAAAGDTVALPVLLASTEPVDAFHLVVRYDPEQFFPRSEQRILTTFVELSSFEPPAREHFDNRFFGIHASGGPSSFDEVAHLSVEGLNKSAIARVKGIAWNTVDRWLEERMETLSVVREFKGLQYAIRRER